MKRLAPLFSLLLLASCGPPLAWDKPDLTDGAKEAEVADCQRLAWRQAVTTENDLAFRYWMGGGATRHPMRYGYYPQPNFNRFAWEGRFFSTCM